MDYDACWDATGVVAAKLDPVLLDFDNARLKQKLKYRGELFPSHAIVGKLGVTFLDYFQKCKWTGVPKGILRMHLGTIP